MEAIECESHDVSELDSSAGAKMFESFCSVTMPDKWNAIAKLEFTGSEDMRGVKNMLILYTPFAAILLRLKRLATTSLLDLGNCFHNSKSYLAGFRRHRLSPRPRGRGGLLKRTAYQSHLNLPSSGNAKNQCVFDVSIWSLFRGGQARPSDGPGTRVHTTGDVLSVLFVYAQAAPLCLHTIVLTQKRYHT